MLTCIINTRKNNLDTDQIYFLILHQYFYVENELLREIEHCQIYKDKTTRGLIKTCINIKSVTHPKSGDTLSWQEQEFSVVSTSERSLFLQSLKLILLPQVMKLNRLCSEHHQMI